MAKGFNIRAWLGLDTKNFNKGIDKSKKETKGLASTFKKLGGMLAGIFAVSQVIEFGKSVFELGAKAEGVTTAFEELNDTELLGNMRKAVKGTISDFDLMQQAVTANEFSIPVENMATMMEFAAVQAQKMGQDVNFMANSITTGLARGSVMILDNLGLSAKDLSDRAKETGDVTSAAFELMKEKLAESGGVMETVAVKQARLNAKFVNAKVAIFNYVNEGIAKITPALQDATESTISFVTRTVNKLKEIRQGWIDLYNESQSFRAVVETIGFVFDVVFEGIKLGAKSVIQVFKSVGSVLAHVFNPANWGADFGKGLKKILREGDAALINDAKEYGNAIAKLYEDANKDISHGRIESEIETNKKVLTNYKKALDETLAADKEYLTKLKKENDKIKTLRAKDVVSTLDTTIQTDKGQYANWVEVTPDNVAAIETQTNAISTLADTYSILGGAISDVFGNNDAAQWWINYASTVVTNVAKIIAASSAMIVAKQGESAANAAAQASSVPGGFIAIPAIIASVLAMFAPLLNMPKFAGGGIVGGTSFSGDKVIAGLNSKEMVLNGSQQNELFQIANGGGAKGGNVEFEIRGDKLVGVLNNYDRKMSNTR